MTLITKAIVIVLYISLLIALFALLPDSSALPLDPGFATALVFIFGYVFAWSTVFTAINVLLWLVKLTFGLELGIWIWRGAQWVLGLTARFVG